MATLSWAEVEPGVVVSQPFTVDFLSALSIDIGFQPGTSYQFAFGGCGNFLTVSPAPICVDVDLSYTMTLPGGVIDPPVSEVPLPAAGGLMLASLALAVVFGSNKRVKKPIHSPGRV